MWALQGDPDRHRYMTAVVALQARSGLGRRLRILEVGSWAGGSALTWAAALDRSNGGQGSVLCVDAWRPYFEPDVSSRSEPVYRSMDDALRSQSIVGLFLHNVQAAGCQGSIVLVNGTSGDVLPLLTSEGFDIVFLDGNHMYEAVRTDLREATRLVRDGGILCGDDLELQAAQVDRAFMMSHRGEDYVKDPRTGTLYHPGVTMAINEHFGAVSAWNGFWALRRRRNDWTTVQLSEGDIPGKAPGHLRRPGPREWDAVAHWLLGRGRLLAALRIIGPRTAIRRALRGLMRTTWKAPTPTP